MLSSTGYAFKLSSSGTALPGMLEEPVNIRQESSDWRSRRSGGAMFLYFGRTRRHIGGSHGFGK